MFVPPFFQITFQRSNMRLSLSDTSLPLLPCWQGFSFPFMILSPRSLVAILHVEL